ncbi:hypothetical protein A5656_02115 [Mycobacterium gordonae]|nr:hypothetical protein [Mycobacterium gordonae]OBK58569.1 hypothetical protein A5656_02115 [Mycobacterium gordonae]
MSDFPDLRVGDRFTTVGRDGVTYTDTIRSVSYSSGSPEIRRRVRWWEWFIPARWRKPVIVQAALPPSVTVNTGESSDAMTRALARVAEVQSVIDRLTK